MRHRREAFDVGGAGGQEGRGFSRREPFGLAADQPVDRAIHLVLVQGSAAAPLAFAEDIRFATPRQKSQKRGTPVAFRWCKEAKEEFYAAVGLSGGSILKGETLVVLKRLASGALDLTETHKIIRQTAVHGGSPWTILYSGGDGTYVGLLFVQARGDQLPPSAYEVAQIRLSNLHF